MSRILCFNDGAPNVWNGLAESSLKRVSVDSTAQVRLKFSQKTLRKSSKSFSKFLWIFLIFCVEFFCDKSKRTRTDCQKLVRFYKFNERERVSESCKITAIGLEGSVRTGCSDGVRGKIDLCVCVFQYWLSVRPTEGFLPSSFQVGTSPAIQQHQNSFPSN